MDKNNLPFSLLSKEIQFFQQNFKQVGIIFVLVLVISFLFPGGETLQYSYKINDNPNAKPTECENHKDSGPYLSNIEAVNSKTAQKETK